MNKNSFFIKVALSALFLTSGQAQELREISLITDIAQEIPQEVLHKAKKFVNISNKAELINEAEISVFELRRQAASQKFVPEYVLDDKVRNYVPSEKDIFMTLEDGRYENLIFGGKKLRVPEQKILNGFRAWVEAKQLPLPPGWQTETCEDCRILMQQKDFQKTYDLILDHDQYLREHIIPFLLDESLVQSHFETGWYYGLGRDRSQRPIFVMSMRKMIDNVIDFDLSLDLIDVLSSYTIVNGLIPGIVETWVAIIDVKDVGLLELPVRSFASWTKRFARGYPARGGKVLFLNTPWVVQKAASIIYSFLGPFASEKTKFYSNDYKPHLHQLVGQENLEKKFGGWIPDKKSDFFPPKYSIKGIDPKLKKNSKPDQQAQTPGIANQEL